MSGTASLSDLPLLMMPVSYVIKMKVTLQIVGLCRYSIQYLDTKSLSAVWIILSELIGLCSLCIRARVPRESSV